MLITALNEKALVLEMPIMVDKKNVIIAPEQRKTPVSLLHGDTSEGDKPVGFFHKENLDRASR